MKSCILCGVGGQGTVLASRILASAAMEKNEFAQTAETIGMAQRGGSVVSHVRIGEDASTPLIPLGSADVMLSFEPCEAARNLKYLKEDGVVITCDRPVQPTTLSLHGKAYDVDEMLDFVKKHSGACYVLPAETIEAGTGSSRFLNVALVGAVAELGILGINVDDVEKILETRIKQTFLEKNKIALRLGRELITQ